MIHYVETENEGRSSFKIVPMCSVGSESFLGIFEQLQEVPGLFYILTDFLRFTIYYSFMQL